MKKIHREAAKSAKDDSRMFIGSCAPLRMQEYCYGILVAILRR